VNRLTQRPGKLDLAVTRGDDAELELRFVTTAGAPVNLAGRTWQLRLTGGTKATLDASVVTTSAAVGVLAFTLPATLVASIKARTFWFLRDATNERTLLDGEVVPHLAGQAGAPVGSVSETVTVTEGTAEVTVTASVAAPGILLLGATEPVPAGYVGLIARRPPT